MAVLGADPQASIKRGVGQSASWPAAPMIDGRISSTSLTFRLRMLLAMCSAATATSSDRIGAPR